GGLGGSTDARDDLVADPAHHRDHDDPDDPDGRVGFEPVPGEPVGVTDGDRRRARRPGAAPPGRVPARTRGAGVSIRVAELAAVVAGAGRPLAVPGRAVPALPVTRALAV